MFSLLSRTLPTFWAERILNLIMCIFWIFRKHQTCGYVAAGFFFFTKKGPHISGSPWLVGTLPQALFFSQKRAPYFLARIHQIWARIMRARHGNILHGTDHEGTARKYLARHGIMRARHGNIWHGTDPPDLGTARHGTSLII